MPISSDLLAVYNSARVPDQARTWLESQGVEAPMDFALLATDENAVTAKIRDVVKTAGHCSDTLVDSLAFSKCWTLCRRAMSQDDQRLKGGVAPPDELLPEPTFNSCTTAWKRVHDFPLGSDRLLTSQLQNKINRGLAAKPRRLDIILAEQLRTAGCLEKRGSVQMVVPTSGPVRGEQNFDSAARSHFELYIRLRAYFTTVAFLSINDRAFLSFGAAEQMSDMLLRLLNNTYSNQMAPVTFYVEAWAQTAKLMSDHVLTNDGSLEEFIKQTSLWRHIWTGYAPTRTNSGPGTPTKLHNGPDTEPDLNDRVQRLRGQLSEMQSQRDRAVAQAKKAGKQVELTPRKDDDPKRRRKYWGN